MTDAPAATSDVGVAGESARRAAARPVEVAWGAPRNGLATFSVEHCGVPTAGLAGKLRRLEELKGQTAVGEEGEERLGADPRRLEGGGLPVPTAAAGTVAWVCGSCTYENLGAADKCEMCETAGGGWIRSSAAPLQEQEKEAWRRLVHAASVRQNRARANSECAAAACSFSAFRCVSTVPTARLSSFGKRRCCDGMVAVDKYLSERSVNVQLEEVGPYAAR